MKIKALSLRNFRRFREFSMEFHSRLTVIVARNGQGKTSVLDAISVVLGAFVSAFDMGKGRFIGHTDVRYQRKNDSPDAEQQYPVVIEAELSASDEKDISVQRELASPEGRTTTKDANALMEYGKSLMDQVRNLDDVILPVISYYGSGRLWTPRKITQGEKKVLSESRTMGFEDCLTLTSSFKQLQKWMGKAEIAVLQQQQMAEYNGNKLPHQVAGIKRAVNKSLSEEGWGEFHYSVTHEELAMHHNELGLLPVSLLSDGVRAMVSLVADLAWRCAKLNPHFGDNASRQTPGVVMIDEVDLHLHPAWQQGVIRSLTETFPKVQFIVTTHSPQVLSTVKKESIQVISFNGDEASSSGQPSAMSYGEESQNVLQAIMGVDPQPPVPERDDLQKLTALVEGGFYNKKEAKSLMENLRETLSCDHPQLQRLERSIRRQEALGK